MKILSLFDGCGMAYQSLKNLNIKIDKYYASEVDSKNPRTEIRIEDIKYLGE